MPERKERAARLREKGEQQMVKFLNAHVGKERQILIEQGGIGRTEHFAQVHFQGDLQPGTLHRVITTEARGGALFGQLVDGSSE